jgi:ppGpp synthetase/RelA/SpoT-type nucleotidyltranferase
MKISKSVRDLFSSQEGINNALAERVKLLFEENKEDNWFYRGRVKKLESFAQKLETGRFNPEALEDFFACTIVVENRHAIGKALQLVDKFCIIQDRRPKKDEETHKTPDLFSFDDLRLYVKLKPQETSPPSPLNDILFEVQIKTFLQHAWSIATHDLIYKGDSISWGKERVAFQIKAMLEHAEVSIDQVEVVSASSALSTTDIKTVVLKDILTWVKESWPEESLPSDIVRLCKLIQSVMTATKLELADIRQAVAIDTTNGNGTKLKNLSPYEIIIKAIFNNKQDNFIAFLKGKGKLKLFITPEMEIELPPNTSNKNLVFANLPKKSKGIGESVYLPAPFVSINIDSNNLSF